MLINRYRALFERIATACSEFERLRELSDFAQRFPPLAEAFAVAHKNADVQASERILEEWEKWSSE